MKIDIVIYEGVEELDALAPYEVLAVAARMGAPFELALVGAHGPDLLRCHHGTQITPARAISDDADLYVVPGGGWTARETVGTWAEHETGVLPAMLAERHAAGARMASVCTGAMLLAKAGLLEGRPATTHRAAFDDLRAAGAEVIHSRVVDDGDVVTSGGVTSGVDLALWLVERECGPALVAGLELLLECERRGTVFRR